MFAHRATPPDTQSQVCPVCQVAMPVNPGYITWCDQCGWNVDPGTITSSRGLFDRLHNSLGERQSRDLLDNFVRGRYQRPRFRFTRFFAYLISGLVHAVIPGVVVVGIATLILGFPSPIAIMAGVLCLGAAWLMRPNVFTQPGWLVTQETAPVMYRLLSSVVQSLGAGRVDAIFIDGSFNAAFDQINLNGRRSLSIGLPLWSIINDEEKVALLAHEIAHGVNGDAARGRFVSSAVDSLLYWYKLLYPNNLKHWKGNAFDLITAPVNLTRLLLAGLVGIAGYMLALLLWRDQQRAEYYADYLAASVSGKRAMLSLIEKLHFNQVFVLAMHQLALVQGQPHDLFADLKQRADRVPQRELERIKRLQHISLSRLDHTHPPTTYRIEMLNTLADNPPRVVLNSNDSEAIETELSNLKSLVQQHLTKQYLAGLRSVTLGQ